jgi:hypothetical protein
MGNADAPCDRTHEEELQSFLWRIMARYDFYIGVTHSKAAVLLAFNTVLLSAVALKWSDLAAMFAGAPGLATAATCFVALGAVACLVAMGAIVSLLNPFVAPSARAGLRPSNIFYCHVARLASGDDFLSVVRAQEPSDRTLDCALQAHALARAVDQKYRRMRLAVRVVLFGELPALGAIFLLKLGQAVLG